MGEKGCLLVLAGLLLVSLVVTLMYSRTLGAGKTLLLCVGEVIVVLVLGALWAIGIILKDASGASSRQVIDLRGAGARRAEREGSLPLRDTELEKLAQRLRRLLNEVRKWDDPTHREIRRIGEQLNAKGGFKLMQEVAYRVRGLGGAEDAISGYWDKIGEWRA